MAFYKGWLPSVLGVIPYVGLNFAVYETLKATLLQTYQMRDERELNIVTRLGCGALAGMTGQTVAYPFDVARRRLQVGFGHSNTTQQQSWPSASIHTGASPAVRLPCCVAFHVLCNAFCA